MVSAARKNALANSRLPRLRGLWETLSAVEDPAEAERDYSEICAYWGRMGGRETLRRHGREHFARIAKLRYERAR